MQTTLVFFIEGSSADEAMSIAEAVYLKFNRSHSSALKSRKEKTWYPKLNSLSVPFEVTCGSEGEAQRFNAEINELIA